MFTLYLQSPIYFKPWPTSLDVLIQEIKTRSYQPWGLQENTEEPIPFPKKGQQDTKGNPLNVCLSSEKLQIWKPLGTKSQIVVLGNFEDCPYQKYQRYAPVLKYISLRLLTAKAVGYKRILQQGDCKNGFCNAILPDNEVTVIRPPIGDPDFQEYEYWLLKKTLHGLCRYPHHWYNTIKGILLKMGLEASPHDPWLLYDTLEKPNSNKTISENQSQLHVGLYVDDFVFYSSWAGSDE